MVLSNDSVNPAYRHRVVRCSVVAASAVLGHFFKGCALTSQEFSHSSGGR